MLTCVCLLNAVARAQTNSDSNLVEALDAALATRSVGSSVEEKKQFVAAAADLCRLLPRADEQIRFLSRRAETYRDSDKNLAFDLANEARMRMRRWREFNAQSIPAEIEQSLKALIDTIQPIVDIIVPDELIARFKSLLDEPDRIAELTPAEKSTLHARGIPESLLGIRSDAPDAIARDLAGELAGKAGELPPIRTLLTRASLILNQPGLRGGFGDEVTGMASEMTTVLFARAMGLDGRDLHPSGDLEKPAYWEIKADTLGNANLWRWEALARILQAASCESVEDRLSAVNAADSAWSKVDAVYAAFATNVQNSRDRWPAVADWLVRLRVGTPDSLESPGQLPLSFDFRSRGRRRRAVLEAEFLRALASGDDNAAFLAMQRAKNAELTLIGNSESSDAVITADAVKRLIGFGGQARPRDIHIYIEIFQTGATGPTMGKLHAFVIRTTSPTIVADTQFESARWYSADGSTEGMTSLLSEAVSTLTGSENLHAIVALDGFPRGVDWSRAENVLLDRIKGPEGWMVYIPTGAAFAKNSPWALDPTLRSWYLSLNDVGRQNGLSYVGTRCDVGSFSLADVNESAKHAMTQIVAKTASRVRSDIACAAGWEKLARTIVLDRKDGTLNIPVIVAK